MEFRFRILAAAAVLAAVCVVVGCGPPKPVVIAGGGVITINGDPLPNAEVRFVPMHEGLDSSFIAIGVSDDDGKFELRFPGKTESTVCAGENRVLVFEGPMPESARGQSEKAILEAVAFTKSLKNRPIPRKYSNLSESPLSVEVTEGKNEYNLELNR